MRIIVLSAVQLAMLEAAVSRAHRDGEQFGLAFDPMDDSIKFKYGTGPWSPPMKTEER